MSDRYFNPPDKTTWIEGRVKRPKYIPIAMCAFCGDDAPYKATDGTPVCENCAQMYKPERHRGDI